MLKNELVNAAFRGPGCCKGPDSGPGGPFEEARYHLQVRTRTMFNKKNAYNTLVFLNITVQVVSVINIFNKINAIFTHYLFL